MLRIYTAFLAVFICITSPGCFTYVTMLAVSPSSKHVLLKEEVTYTGAEISSSGWVRLLLDGLAPGGRYERCIAPGGDRLTHCPFDFTATGPAKDPMKDRPNGLFYLKYNIALFSPRLQKSFYDKYHGQFGAPTAAWISRDGSRIHMEYWNTGMHKVTCYLRSIDYSTSDMDFLGDCQPGRPPAGFERMERIELRDAVLVELFPTFPILKSENQRHRYVWLSRPGPAAHIAVYDVAGIEPESGYPILYILYPATIALDILTFPIQYFLWRPPCPLG